ncbi:MAG: hypothetical protein HZB18_09915 [Chloroflexi bacterium]|nr:hypothetical protein [Chloroflexota bacterium]
MKEPSNSSENPNSNEVKDPSGQNANALKFLWGLIKYGGGAIVSALATGYAANYFDNGCTNSSYFDSLPLVFIVSFVLWLGVFLLLKGSTSSVYPAQIVVGMSVVALVVFSCVPILGFWIAPVCN